MSDILMKILIMSAWSILSRLFSVEFRNRLLSLVSALVDVDMPGAMKLDMIHKFGKQSLENVTPIMSAALSMFITAAFGMLQSQGQTWVNKQIGGPVDVNATLAQLESLANKR